MRARLCPRDQETVASRTQCEHKDAPGPTIHRFHPAHPTNLPPPQQTTPYPKTLTTRTVQPIILKLPPRAHLAPTLARLRQLRLEPCNLPLVRDFNGLGVYLQPLKIAECCLPFAFVLLCLCEEVVDDCSWRVDVLRARSQSGQRGSGGYGARRCDRACPGYPAQWSRSQTTSTRAQ